MKCDACGADNSAGLSDCEYCGSSLGGAAQAAPQRPPANSPAPARESVARTTSSSFQGSTFTGGRDPHANRPLLILGIVAVVGLVLGVGGLFSSGQAKALEGKVLGVRVQTVEEALEAGGMVCVEGFVPEAQSPVTIPGVGTACLYFEEKHERRDRSRNTRSSSSSSSSGSRSRGWSSWKTTSSREVQVPEFKAGELVIRPQGATWRETRELHQTQDRTSSRETRVTYSGVPVGTQLTVIGRAQGGTLSGGDPFIVAAVPSKQALVDQLESTASVMKVVGFLGLFVALAAGVGAALVFLKR